MCREPRASVMRETPRYCSYMAKIRSDEARLGFWDGMTGAEPHSPKRFSGKMAHRVYLASYADGMTKREMLEEVRMRRREVPT